MAFRYLTQNVHRSVYPAIDPSNPSNSAQGKTVIVSGGASGLGYAIARGFALAGADTVIVLARRQEALDQASAKLLAEITAAKSSTNVWTYLLDITEATEAQSVFEAIRKRLNEGTTAEDVRDADILVTSAANLMQGFSTLELGAQAFRDSFGTNVSGNLNLVQAFLMPEIPAIPFTAMSGKEKNTTGAQVPRREKIILDVSTGATYLTLSGQAAYSASKLAFTRIMNHLQRDVDSMGGAPIRIHSFQPGTVLTPGTTAVVGDEEIAGLAYDDENLPGSFAVWLASPAAAFLKGRFVWSNWDVEELVAMKSKFEQDPEFCTITLKM